MRAQLLATEHWGLPASRSATQSGVLTRISMFLTFTSASIVSVALGLATRFSDAFILLAVIVLFIDVVMGQLTQIRVLNVASEDLCHVAGSSMIFMTTANAALTAVLPGLLLTLFGAGMTAAVIAGAVSAVVFVAAWSVYGYRSYSGIRRRDTPLSPTPPGKE